MEHRPKLRMGPVGYIIILQIATIGFFGLMFIGIQLQSLDIKQIASQANETATDTNEIISSGNRTSAIVNEVRSIANDISKNFTVAELSRQNQTKVFLPALQNSFDNVERIVNITNDLRVLIPNITNSVNNVTAATNFLAQNFGPDTGYIERENFQYKQANETSGIIKEMREQLRLLNQSLP